MPNTRWITHFLCIGLAGTFTYATTCLRLPMCCLRFNNDAKSNHCIECISGHFGPICNNTCRYPTYGKECQLICLCDVTDCSYAHGCRRKDCPPGFQGPYCSKKCRHPNYGIKCQSECLCGEQHCNHITGCTIRNTTDYKYVRNDSGKEDRPHLTLGITGDSSASIILEKGVPLNCSTMRPYDTLISSELKTMVTSLCVLIVAFLLIMWIYHKLNTTQQETFHWVRC
ncbi:multiple epidermal growth factor-like domains protein 10 [Crassostrea angulata]|uniref:multiple epidermal growth factor-like domains protein 10 n=1 Tax=Magallana angulata TaxID=2784310 RepID=UPI0022B0D085|nr:multiple epidermal growth factor-like domains protein 10 [Crassostrea angulata]